MVDNLKEKKNNIKKIFDDVYFFLNKLLFLY